MKSQQRLQFTILLRRVNMPEVEKFRVCCICFSPEDEGEHLEILHPENVSIAVTLEKISNISLLQFCDLYEQVLICENCLRRMRAAEVFRRQVVTGFEELSANAIPMHQGFSRSIKSENEALKKEVSKGLREKFLKWKESQEKSKSIPIKEDPPTPHVEKFETSTSN